MSLKRQSCVALSFAVACAVGVPAQAQTGRRAAAAAKANAKEKEKESNAEVDDLRKEVQRLQSQVDTLRAAIMQTLEADRERLSNLTRALAPAAAAEAPAAEASTKAPSLSTPGAPAAAPRPVVRKPVITTGTVHGRIEVPAGEAVAYVYVENVPGPVVSGQKVKIDQVRKQFVPSWAVVQRGTVVEFPNLDNIYHNVFSLSTGNSFDLGLYNSQGEAKTHRFMQPGAVDVFCNIHPQMAASVLVVPSRLFAKVNANGTFELRDVPSGRRKMVAWSPRSRLAAEWVEVTSGGDSEVLLKLESKTPGHRNKMGRPYGSYE